MTATNVTKDIDKRELVIERVFDAPRKRMWEAWSNPDSLVRWWGPRGWQTEIKTFEFTPGGIWHYGMKCNDEDQEGFYGQVSWGKAIFQQIIEPEKIIYKDYFSDIDGNIDTSLPEMVVTVEFIEKDGKTTLVSRAQFATDEAFTKVIDMGVVEGMSQTWDRLEEYVTEKVK